MNKLSITLAAILALFMCSCATVPQTPSERNALDTESRSALTTMIARDPSIKPALDKAYACVVFPTVGKGGFIAGGAFGQGCVFRNDKLIGYSSVTAGSIGGQIGGRAFSELLLIDSQSTLERFKHKDAAYGVEATAIAVTEGSSAQINYHDGVAVIVQQKAGLMADASFSGQSFTFDPIDTSAPQKVADTSAERE